MIASITQPKKLLILLAIVFVAWFLRFWNVGSLPMSLNWDEVAFGYNAYALGTDGKDEFGVFLPYKYLESFGDFKPPLYAYLTVLPVKFFGLTEFATRFPSVLLGTITVLLTYFLVKRIFLKTAYEEAYAFFAAGLLAVSPWHINLSRGAFEANVATFLLVCGVLTFLLGVQKNKWFLIASAMVFALSFYTFNTSRIVAPLLVMGLVLGFHKALLRMKMHLILPIIVGGLMVLPLVSFLLSPQASLRFEEVNIFSDIELVEVANQQIANDGNAFWSNIIHNRRVAYVLTYLKHYFDNFNPSFLFISGDVNHRLSTKDVGLLYLWELPFFLVGFLFLFKEKKAHWWIIPLWIVVGIVPAATARETPHALRTETIIPTLQIISAIGIVKGIEWIQSFRYSLKVKKLIFFLLFFSLFLNVVYYLHGYHTHYGRESAGEWIYGYKESIEYVKQVQNQYDSISMTTKLGRPYVYYLFYLKTDPAFFRNNADIHRDAFGFVTVKKFGKYLFEDSLPRQKNNNILYIRVPEDVPEKAHVVKEFRLPDGYHRLTAFTL